MVWFHGNFKNLEGPWTLENRNTNCKDKKPQEKVGGGLICLVLFCFLFEAGLHCTAQAGLELTTLLPLECWEDRHHHTPHAEALTVGLPSRRLLGGLNSNLPAVERE